MTDPAEHAATVREALVGIDLDECEDKNGWWETGEGAKFGAERKAIILAAVDALEAEAEEQEARRTTTIGEWRTYFEAEQKARAEAAEAERDRLRDERDKALNEAEAADVEIARREERNRRLAARVAELERKIEDAETDAANARSSRDELVEVAQARVAELEAALRMVEMKPYRADEVARAALATDKEQA